MLITEPVVSGKTCAIGFWFFAGSRLEPDGMHGVTHFVEHMLFKGTKSRSFYEIASSFDRIGGYINAFTEREDVCVYCVVPSRHVLSAFEIMADMTEASVFPEAELERERRVIQSEIITSCDDAEEAALDAVSESIWPSNPLSRTISGSVTDVEGITRKELVGWYNKYFKKGELCICVTGGFDQNQIQSLSAQLGQHKKIRKNHFPKKTPEWKGGISFIMAPFQQEQFFLLFPKYRIDSEKDYYALLVLNALTGDTMSSRLFQRLREKGGYCYNVYSFFNLYENAGCWCAYASSAKASSAKIVSDIADEIKLLLENPPSNQEIELAREHLAGEELIASDDAEFRMKRLYRNYIFGFEQKNTSGVIECIRRVTFEDVMCVAKKLFDFEKFAFVVFGPKLTESRKEQIKKIIYGELNERD